MVGSARNRPEAHFTVLRRYMRAHLLTVPRREQVSWKNLIVSQTNVASETSLRAENEVLKDVCFFPLFLLFRLSVAGPMVPI